MKHIKHGDLVVHVADDVAVAMEGLAEALNRAGMSASLTLPATKAGGTVVLRLLSPGDLEIDEKPVEGFAHWQVVSQHGHRAAFSNENSHLGFDDLD